MSSIRPLATITVLAFVGVFLYLKINETEPPLPEGVEDWSAATDIEFDMGGTAPSAGSQFATSPTASQAPAFLASAEIESAPAFDSTESAPNFSAPAVATSGSAAPAFGHSGAMPGGGPAAAPTWSDAPASSSSQSGVSSTPTWESASAHAAANNSAESSAAPQLPDLPPLPALPPTPFIPPTASVNTDATLAKTGSSPYSINDPPTSASLDAAQPTLPPLTSARVATETSSATSASPDSGVTSASSAAPTQSSPFSATRLAVQAALDRGELSQALLLLSEWYGDPSLSPNEATEVNSLLSQLAGSVIYSTEHRLVPSYMVQAGERLETIAKEHDVPWQLLAKINGITSADQLQPGQKLKVVRGPFSALIDLSQRKLTLMLDRRYAGQFALDVDPDVTVEEGQWEVNQKLLTPANVSLPGGSQPTSREERSLMLSSTSTGATQVAILRGSTASNSIADPAGRVLRLKPTDAADVFDILSLGSKVVIRR